MNRIPLFFGAQSDSLNASSENWSAVARSGYVRTLGQYRLFCPVGFEPHYAYPLLLWLHSGGHDAEQLLRVMPWISLRNFVAVAPCAPRFDQECGGYFWPTDTGRLEAAEETVFAALEAARRHYPVHPQRIFVAGYQDGGTLALHLGLTYPGQFAGAASINGPYPRDARPLRCLAQLRRLPLWIAQGDTATLYPTPQLQEDMKLFHAAGMTVMVRQYTCGDEIHARMLADLNTWIMEKIAQQAQPESYPC